MDTIPGELANQIISRCSSKPGCQQSVSKAVEPIIAETKVVDGRDRLIQLYALAEYLRQLCARALRKAGDVTLGDVLEREPWPSAEQAELGEWKLGMYADQVDRLPPPPYPGDIRASTKVVLRETQGVLRIVMRREPRIDEVPWDECVDAANHAAGALFEAYEAGIVAGLPGEAVVAIRSMDQL